MQAITIPGFEILDTLYQSVDTVVLRALQKPSDTPVVLKALISDRPSKSRSVRYRREFEIAQQSRSSLLVRALSLATSQLGPLLVFEDTGGISLDKLLARGLLPINDALDIAIQIAEGLEELHSHGIMHKDINPSNVTINEASGKVTIIDFDLASTFGRENPLYRGPDLIEGTLAYMSPEQTGRMNRLLDYRTDFYSFGVLLHEIFTGIRPFSGTDALDLIHQHLSRIPLSAELVRPELPAALGQIILKLIAKTADDRYQSAWGVRADLLKCRSLYQTGANFTFPLGSQDISDHFQVSQKLYGRSSDLHRLLSIFDTIASGSKTVVRITGQPGIGKTTLVREIFRSVTQHFGYVVSGKFDQLQNNGPYSALVSVFSDLVKQILAESEAMLDFWRTTILNTLGPNGSVITDMLSDMELLIGKQPKAPELPPEDARNRFHQVFQSFIQCFCQPHHPLVVFLDDMQWADQATLRLLQDLLANSQTAHLLVLCAYRDSEVNDEHPLSQMFRQLADAAIEVPDLPLKPLNETDITELLADTLKRLDSEVVLLAQHIHRKTSGNPFFVHQLLQTFHEQGFLKFERYRSSPQLEQRRWCWNLAMIENASITEDVVTLMLGAIGRLPAACSDLLKIAACLGNHFDLPTLSLAVNSPPVKCFRDLSPALQADLLVPVSSLDILSDNDNDSALVYSEFKFSHDRVQQAAYALIGKANEAKLHFDVASALDNDPENQNSDRIFVIADRYAAGRSCLQSEKQRRRVIDVNCAAADRAKGSSAYLAAIKYTHDALNYLSEPWTSDPDLSLKLHRSLAELEYLNGNYGRSAELVETIWNNCSSNLDRAEALTLLITQNAVLGRNADASSIAERALNAIGLSLPEPHHVASALKEELWQIWSKLGDRPIGDLVNLPEMTDPVYKIAIKILMTLHTPVYFSGDYELYSWVLARMTNISLTYGNAPESSKGYASFGNTIAANNDQFQKGYEFGLLAVQLAKKVKSIALLSKAYLILTMFLNCWVRPLRESDFFDQEGHRLGIEAGDRQFVGYFLTYGRTVNRLHQGIALDVLQADTLNHLAYCQRIRHHLSSDTICAARLVMANLAGLTENIDSYDTQDSSESDYISKSENHNSKAALAFFYLFKAQSLYLYHKYNLALDAINQSHVYLGALKGVVTAAEFLLYEGLILAANLPSGSALEKEQWLDRIASNRMRLDFLASQCPENFEHRSLLLQAEYARLTQSHAHIVLCNRAVESAKKSGVLQHIALGNELLAHYWQEEANPAVAISYAYHALHAYRSWGAKRKADLLLEHFPLADDPPVVNFHRFLEGPNPDTASPNPELRSSTSSSHSLPDLDLSTVIRAASAMSGEVELARLVDRLLVIALQNAGAQSAYLIMKEGNALVLKARIRSGEENACAYQDLHLEDFREIPRSIVQFVNRTRQLVILNHASREGIFTRDPYCQSNDIKSVLCLPIIHQATMQGILYLENNELTGAFPQTRVDWLALLSTHAAVSLQNARLYQSLRHEIEERKRSEENRQILEQQLLQSQKMEAIGTLAGGIAHDFNNILTGIVGFSQLARISALTSPTETIENLNEVLACASRAVDLVRQILSFSRHNAPVPRPIRISELLIESLRMVRATLPSSTEIIQQIEEPQAWILADSTQIHQIILNICTNASHAMHGKGTLHVRLKSAPGNSPSPAPSLVSLEFEDNGVGIAQEDLNKIFQPFFTTKQEGKGTGLGLSVVHGIVKNAGGTITVRSAPNQGTTFIVQLPCIEPPLTTQPQNTTQPRRGNEHVLVVDDEDSVIITTSRLLGGLGYSVTCASSAAEALSILQRSDMTIDLIITDQIMPKMKGTEFAEQVAKDYPQIPIILSTGYSEEPLGQEFCQRIHIYRVLNKPMTIDLLSLHVREVIDNARRAAPSN